MNDYYVETLIKLGLSYEESKEIVRKVIEDIPFITSYDITKALKSIINVCSIQELNPCHNVEQQFKRLTYLCNKKYNRYNERLKMRKNKFK